MCLVQDNFLADILLCVILIYENLSICQIIFFTLITNNEYPIDLRYSRIDDIDIMS